jgi:prevent-host-death family protein
MKTISAADANRHFSSLLRDVATGDVITVLSRGKPVATIGPARVDSGEREAAKRQLMDRLSQQTPHGSRNWTRDDLYEADR